jgi:hypothetical protein
MLGALPVQQWHGELDRDRPVKELGIWPIPAVRTQLFVAEAGQSALVATPAPVLPFRVARFPQLPLREPPGESERTAAFPRTAAAELEEETFLTRSGQPCNQDSGLRVRMTADEGGPLAWRRETPRVSAMSSSCRPVGSEEAPVASGEYVRNPDRRSPMPPVLRVAGGSLLFSFRPPSVGYFVGFSGPLTTAI